MAIFKTVIFVFLLAHIVFAKHEQYDGHSLYGVKVNNEKQAALIRRFGDELLLEVLISPKPGLDGEVLVPKEKKHVFEKALTIEDIEFHVKVENIKELLDREDELLASASSKRNNRTRIALPYDEIHRLEVVDQYLRRLADTYPNIVTVQSAGRSFEGRDMNYLKISTTNFQDRRKPIVYIQSLLKGCEWVTLPATLYAIEKLVVDVTESDLVRDIDWIILPVANPDGYVFTHVADGFRFWRKNRATGYMIGDFCRGVDLNANFDIFWGTASSDSPCDYFFHGRSGFSEPETRNIRSILHEYSDRIELFIDLNSFGSLVLYGYGNGQLPSNGLTLHYNGVNMAQAIDRVKWEWKRDYTVGNVALTQGRASGLSSDYAQGIGIPMAYKFELPSFQNVQGSSMVGVLVDPEFIEQAGFETWEGIKVGARFARDNYRRRHV